MTLIWYDQWTTFEIFSALVYDLYARFVVRVFGFQLRFDDKGRQDTKFKCSHAGGSAMHASWGYANERSIPSIEGTREKLIEKHFDGTTRRTSVMCGDRARFFHLSSERKAEVRSRDGRNERGRHGARKRWQRKPIWWLMRGSRQLSAFRNDRERKRKSAREAVKESRGTRTEMVPT